MTTVWVGDVDHLRQGCFYFYFQNASTFASLHALGGCRTLQAIGVALCAFKDGRPGMIDQECTVFAAKNEGYESCGFHPLHFWTSAFGDVKGWKVGALHPFICGHDLGLAQFRRKIGTADAAGAREGSR